MNLMDQKRRMFKERLQRTVSLHRLSMDDLTPGRWFKKPPNPEINAGMG
ncbi:MAG: hypothetical protein AABW68_02150 [archaeon]